MFRTALDALARHLTRWHGCYIEGSEGEVQLACNYPVALQVPIMQLAETVQALQDWDSHQPNRATCHTAIHICRDSGQNHQQPAA
jgi:hypothetical protein